MLGMLGTLSQDAVVSLRKCGKVHDSYAPYQAEAAVATSTMTERMLRKQNFLAQLQRRLLLGHAITIYSRFLKPEY